MRRLMVALVLSLFAVLPVACDSTDVADTKPQPTEDVAEPQDIPESPSGYKGMESLCPVIVTCDFGFTQTDCLAEFLSYCKSSAGKTTYVDCMSDCHEAYTGAKDCEAFRTCETKCWNDSGC